MQDEQIERMLTEAGQAFMVSEAMRPFHAAVRLFKRCAAHADAEECAAWLLVLDLATERWAETVRVCSSVAIVLCASIRSDGLSRPPSVRAIARRLAVAPGSVENALSLLVERGLVVEVPPKGFVLRRRCFRFLTLDVQAFASATLGLAVSRTNEPATE
jgi:hypothetical protein